MNIDNDEKIIRDALNTIYTKDLDIHSNLKRKMYKRKHKPFMKAIIGVCIAALSAVICVPVMADKIPSFRNLLLSINSGFESMIQPVELVSVDNGIKMEVVGAMNDSEMAVIYITLQDLEGNRVDETIDLYDSYRLTGGRSFTSEVVAYDENSKTATLRIQVNGGNKLSGKELEFSFREFISGKKVIDTIIDRNVLSSGLEYENINTILLDMDNISGGGGRLFDEYKNMGIIKVLKPDEKKIVIPDVDFMYISNMGVIDGRLHVQTKCSKKGFDSYGYFYFTDKLGNKIEPKQANIYFGIDNNEDTSNKEKYVEYIYDLSEIYLSDLNLNAYMVSSDNYTRGNWKARFKVEPVKEEKIKCNINVGESTIEEVVISPLGLVLETNGAEVELPSIEIIMEDGRKESIIQSVGYTENNKGSIKFISAYPVDIAKIKAISIEGNIVTLDFN